MKRIAILFSVVFILTSFVDGTVLKELDLGVFKITIPANWDYVKEQGDDSFVGKISMEKASLTFDFSTAGYAANLNDIEVPENIKTTTDKNYIIKTMWPKVTGKGFTAIYFKSTHSSTSFNIIGENLSLEEQTQALAAFKTIVIKQ